MSNATETIDQRQWMLPGFYWIVLDRKYQSDTLWGQFQRLHPEVKARKVEGEWMLLEVTGDQPVVWTLPGFPSPAPKGLATTRADTETVPAPIPDATGTGGAIDQWLGQVSLIGKVVLWGSAAVVLLALYQNIRSAGAQKKVERHDVDPDDHDTHPSPPPSVPPSKGLKSAKSTWISRPR